MKPVIEKKKTDPCNLARSFEHKFTNYVITQVCGKPRPVFGLGRFMNLL